MLDFCKLASERGNTEEQEKEEFERIQFILVQSNLWLSTMVERFVQTGEYSVNSSDHILEDTIDSLRTIEDP